LRGRRVSYVEYNAAFDNTIELFYPEGEPRRESASKRSARGGRVTGTLASRLRRWRLLR
jgi:hypothetical protein